MTSKLVSKIAILALIAIAAAVSSCNNSKSYAEYLDDERKACNLFLSTQRVVDHIPADGIFEVGVDAPFYRMTTDGDVYMQVLNAGTDGNKAYDGQVIYFRFMRMNLINWTQTGENTDIEGNAANVGTQSQYFRYNDYTLSSSSQWGYGLQIPLKYLGIDCEVNLLIKSQYGYSSEISYVQPYLYMNVRYFKSQI